MGGGSSQGKISLNRGEKEKEKKGKSNYTHGFHTLRQHNQCSKNVIGGESSEDSGVKTEVERRGGGHSKCVVMGGASMSCLRAEGGEVP